MNDIAIRVENLSKQYRIGGKQDRYKTLRDTLADAATAPLRRLRGVVRGQSSVASDETIWALKDVSFEVKRGEVVGIIGRNGAGKTTLLKVLSRITEPTEGRARIRGRVGSLLEVGTGFHPELTGRENIYLNGAILGMKRAEIEHKFDEIVDFSGVEKFMDTPVKHYSSGMHVRLAFAVAAHLEPEILLVDEVLAVGDAEFQKKCLGKMDEVAKGGRTILFVSHNMGAITNLCSRTLWLHDGQLHMQGASSDIVSEYLIHTAELAGKFVMTQDSTGLSENEFILQEISLKNDQGETTSSFDMQKSMFVEIKYQLLKRLPYCRIGIIVSTIDGTPVFDSYDSDLEEFRGVREAGAYTNLCKIPDNLLSPNRYVVSFNAGVPRVRNLMRLEGVLQFDVKNIGATGSVVLGRRRGIIRPALDWEVFHQSNGQDIFEKIREKSEKTS